MTPKILNSPFSILNSQNGRAARSAPYRLPATNALKSLSQEVPTAFTE